MWCNHKDLRAKGRRHTCFFVVNLCTVVYIRSLDVCVCVRLCHLSCTSSNHGGSYNRIGAKRVV